MRPARALATIAVAALITTLAPAAADAATTSTITGRVTDTRGKPLGGITVDVSRGDTTAGAVRTRDDGSFRVVVPSDLGRAEVCAGGFGPSSADTRFETSCADASPGQKVDLSLVRLGLLRGKVTDIKGKPVAGAVVVGCVSSSGALGDTSGGPARPVRTRADGTYSVPLSAGLVAVTVSKKGYATSRYLDEDCTGPFIGEQPSTRMPVGRNLGGIDVVLPKRGVKVAGKQRPYVAGTAHPGWTLTARPGVWKPRGVTVSYQWFNGQQKIEGATEATLRAPENGYLEVRVYARKRGYVSAIRTVTVGHVTPAPATTAITSRNRPYAVGTPKVGWTLSARPGTWSPAAVSVSYRWTIDGAVVSTEPTMVPTSAQQGKAISLTATASAKGYRSASRTVPAGVVG